MTIELKTPVAMFLFNRPETTERVFAEIARARPSTLLLVADGPRPHVVGESDRCQKARAIVEQVDWPCTVVKNYSETNLGCRRRMSSGMDWVFQTVPEAIILEDDCLPHPTFFPFCEAMLERYRDDTRIGQVSGCNFQFGQRRGSDSYYFSRYNHVWGWASWRRSWRNYDVTMSRWPQLRDEGWLADALGDAELVASWSRIFDDVHAGKIDTWDYQWTFTAFIQSTLTVLPNVNLISNIGFGAGGTNTLKPSPLANVPLATMDNVLRHPSWIIRSDVADRQVELLHKYRRKKLSVGQKLKREARRIVKQISSQSSHP